DTVHTGKQSARERLRWRASDGLLRSRCSALLLLHGVEFCHLGPLVLPGNDTHAAKPRIPDGGYVVGACVSAYKWCAAVHQENYFRATERQQQFLEDLCLRLWRVIATSHRIAAVH